LQLLSPLGEAAERVAAEEAQRFGYALVTALPFAAGAYGSSLGEGKAAFRALCESAGDSVLVLDGDPAERAASCRAVRRTIVRNCDLLIAVGQAGAPGEPAETVRYALRCHVPVWSIDAAGARAPRLLRGPIALRRPDTMPEGAAAEIELRTLLRRAMEPPAAPEARRSVILGDRSEQGSAAVPRRSNPFDDYLAESKEEVRPLLWRAYRGFVAAVRTWSSADPTPPSPPQPPEPQPPEPAATGRDWERFYDPADAMAEAYADRYRSSYVLVIALAALALATTGLALAFPHTLGKIATALELAAFIAIGSLVYNNLDRRWHERWIAYRLLAEVCRKQRVLAAIGWSLPAWEVERLAADPQGGKPPHDAWVAWYAAAAMRASSLPQGEMRAHVPRALALGQALVLGQIRYHRTRRETSRHMVHQLERLGESFFLLTFGAIVTKLLLLIFYDDHDSAAWFGLLCAVLAALSAAFVSVRAYAEFDLLRLQSERMSEVMKDAGEALQAIDPAAPLASQELGATLQTLALAMLQDVQGWSQLFRTKAPEPG
jgi:hypothetical protein